MEIQKNIRGKPFDFQSWREWLREKTEELRKEGFQADFGFNDVGSKPSSGISVQNDTRAGYFSNWKTGETDFGILDKKSRQDTVSKMGLIVEDSTFVDAFEEFVAALKS